MATSSEVFAAQNRLLDNNLYDNLIDIAKQNITKVEDVSVQTLQNSVYLNFALFVVLTLLYELLRQRFPSIYNGRKYFQKAINVSLPANFCPLGWIPTVYKVEWNTVLEYGGHDAYWFLRYIRMLLRITGATAFWAMTILVPLYFSGGGSCGANNDVCEGFYSIGMSNIAKGSETLWVSTVFLWLFSLYVYYVMKKEYRLFVYLRMRFMGKGDPSLDPQHFYSVIVEKIPIELRSDKALFDYFSSLFPGKIHSASVVLNVPELEALSIRRKRVVHRLEKAIAAYESSGGGRPIHLIKRPRTMPSIGCPYRFRGGEQIYEGENPPHGVWVDSIKYYVKDLNEMNRQLADLQLQCVNTAHQSNTNTKAAHWISKVTKADRWISKVMHVRTSRKVDEVISISETGSRNRSGSHIDAEISGNNLKAEPLRNNEEPTACSETSDRGEVCPENLSPLEKRENTALRLIDRRKSLLYGHYDLVKGDLTFKEGEDQSSPTQTGVTVVLNQVIKEFGLDFVQDSLYSIDNEIENYVGEVAGLSISSTGFITFKDLASKTCAVSTPATSRYGTLHIDTAPEARDVIWKNLPRDSKFVKRKIFVSSIFSALGALFWSIPISLIQAYANTNSLSNVPGLSRLLEMNESGVVDVINSYLPVVLLLVIISILPIIFEKVALHYEQRKTLSAVQHAVLTRYFSYQLANIYVTVTAASIWDSLANFLELSNLSDSLLILGENLSKVVGYFASLVVTKTLAGLPLVELRLGELIRRTFLRIIFREKKLTQRELDEIYRPQKFLYGREYPTQLFVITICFTYAVISPIILPFATVYFVCALLIYKKQMLFVYTPEYESGGEHFPIAMDRTLVGLVCGQITYVAFIFLREGVESFEYFAILPLPFLTMFMRARFDRRYVKPCNNLSLERARGVDIEESEKISISEEGDLTSDIASTFNEHAYRQPVLTEGKAEPLPYRIGTKEKLKDEIAHVLHLDSSSSSYLKMMDSTADNSEVFGFRRFRSAVQTRRPEGVRGTIARAVKYLSRFVRYSTQLLTVQLHPLFGLRNQIKRRQRTT